MSVRSRLTALAAVAVSIAALGLTAPVATASPLSDFIDTIGAGSSDPGTTAPESGGVFYDEVHFHLHADNCKRAFSAAEVNGSCGGTFTAGHSRGFDGPGFGSVTWTEGERSWLTFLSYTNPGASLDAIVPTRSSPNLIPINLGIAGDRYKVGGVDLSLPAGTRGAALHINVQDFGNFITGWGYDMYVDGFVPRA